VITVLEVLALFGAFFALVVPEIHHASKHPHYPRPRVLYMIWKTGAEFGWWKDRDCFGLMWPQDRLPLPPEQPPTLRIGAEVTELNVGEIRQGTTQTQAVVKT